MCPTDLRSSWSSVSDAEELNLHYLIQKSKVYRRRTVYVFMSDMVHNFGKTKWGHAGLEDVTWPFVKKFENMAKTTPNIFCPKKQQRLLCLIEPLVLSFFLLSNKLWDYNKLVTEFDWNWIPWGIFQLYFRFNEQPLRHFLTSALQFWYRLINVADSKYDFFC